MGSLENIATAMGLSNRHGIDGEVRTAVENALRDSPNLDALDLDVTVEGGCVRLAGKVGSYAERSGAEQVADTIQGVTNVENHIHVRPYGANWAISDGQIAQTVGRALAGIPSVDASRVEFDVSCHVVTLIGSTRSVADRVAVRHAVEILPGVDFVQNLIEVPHVD